MNLTQRGLGCLLGVSTAKVHSWESGKTKFPTGIKRRVEIIEERNLKNNWQRAQFDADSQAWRAARKAQPQG